MATSGDRLDERLDDESRSFIANLLRFMRPVDLTNPNIEHTRKLQRIACMAQRHIFEDSDQINVTEFTVANTHDAHSIVVKSFVPKQLRDEAPVTVFFHGGGFVIGSTDTHFACIASLAIRTQSVWLSVEYRLAPEHKFDTIIGDCASVVDWALDKAHTLTSNLTQVGLLFDLIENILLLKYEFGQFFLTIKMLSLRYF